MSNRTPNMSLMALVRRAVFEVPARKNVFSKLFPNQGLARPAADIQSVEPMRYLGPRDQIQARAVNRLPISWIAIVDQSTRLCQPGAPVLIVLPLGDEVHESFRKLTIWAGVIVRCHSNPALQSNPLEGENIARDIFWLFHVRDSRQLLSRKFCIRSELTTLFFVYAQFRSAHARPLSHAGARSRY
jgi:hypothetical protein